MGCQWVLCPSSHQLLQCTCRRPGAPHGTLLRHPCSTWLQLGQALSPAGGRQLFAEGGRSQTARKAGSAGYRGVGPSGGCPAGVTWSGCTQCCPWWRCRTMAGSCRASCGPGGRSCVGWSTGSGLLTQNPGAVCSPCGSIKEDSDLPCLPCIPGWHHYGAHVVTCRTGADGTPFPGRPGAC